MFGLFKKKQPKQTPRKYLGFDLNKYMYLGWTEFYWCKSDSDVRSHSYRVYLFVSRENNLDRGYALVSDNPRNDDYYKPMTHKFFHSHILSWVAGTREVWDLSYNWVSQEFNEFMLDEYSFKWSHEKKWWVSNEEIKYEAALRKVKTQKPEEVEHTSNNNVITVDFG